MTSLCLCLAEGTGVGYAQNIHDNPMQEKPHATPATPPSPSQPELSPQVQEKKQMETIHHAIVMQQKEHILTPGEVRNFRRQVMDNQAEMASPSYTGKVPQVRRKDVTYILEAGRNPEPLQLSRWTPTPIAFLDRFSHPLSIETLSWNRSVFGINGIGCSAEKGQDGHQNNGGEAMPDREALPSLPRIIYVVPCKPSEWGSISVKLRNYAIPLVFIISASPQLEHIDTPVIVTVQQATPAHHPIRHKKPVPKMAPEKTYTPPPAPVVQDITPLLQQFLSTTPPKGAQALSVKGHARAWQYQGKFYLKTEGRLAGQSASAQATAGPSTLYRFDRPLTGPIHLVRKGRDEQIEVGLSPSN